MIDPTSLSHITKNGVDVKGMITKQILKMFSKLDISRWVSDSWLRNLNWIYGGIPPEPRIFIMTKGPILESITTNDNFEGSDEFIDHNSGDYCNTAPVQ